MSESAILRSELPPLVAIVNTSKEIASMVAWVLADEGLRTITVSALDLVQGEPTAATFLTENDPRVIVYDVGLPYEESWAFLQSLEQSDAARGRRFIITTTNRTVLEDMVGVLPEQEVLVSPFDPDDLVAAVRRALATQ